MQKGRGITGIIRAENLLMIFKMLII
jgi:hypothetical protein